jgi:anti-sigma B factor antagonist
VTDAEPIPEPAVVALPAEIDISNAGTVATQLRASITSAGSIVVADLTTTTFCDSSGLRILLLARDWAAADGIELRLAVPPGPMLVVLKVVGLDQLLPVYPALDEALAAPPGDVARPKPGISRESAGPSAVNPTAPPQDTSI